MIHQPVPQNMSKNDAVFKYQQKVEETVVIFLTLIFI